MIETRLSNDLRRWLVAGTAVVVMAAGAAYVGWFGDDDDGGERQMHVEEFRVAEPLRGDPEAVLRDQLKTITAVTEPYDEVEASVEGEPERLAETRDDLYLQCVTVLKEMAFCTGEDAFLEVIGTASNLETSGQRARFMDRVQLWFEPGGAGSDCEDLLNDDHFESWEYRQTWQQASGATVLWCEDYGQALHDAEIFDEIGVFWEREDGDPEDGRR